MPSALSHSVTLFGLFALLVAVIGQGKFWQETPKQRSNQTTTAASQPAKLQVQDAGSVTQVVNELGDFGYLRSQINEANWKAGQSVTLQTTLGCRWESPHYEVLVRVVPCNPFAPVNDPTNTGAESLHSSPWQPLTEPPAATQLNDSPQPASQQNTHEPVNQQHTAGEQNDSKSTASIPLGRKTGPATGQRFGNERTLQTELTLLTGPQRIEFKLIPTASNPLLTAPKVFEGWRFWARP